MHPTVLEREWCAAKAECSEHRLMGNRAECQDRTEPGHSADLGGQKPTAVRDLARFGLVLRRDAANSIGDAHAAEFKTVVQARQRVLGDVATKLRALQDAMDALSSPALYADTQTVESGDPTKVTATRTSGTCLSRKSLAPAMSSMRGQT